jgi:hypothetical protein
MDIKIIVNGKEVSEDTPVCIIRNAKIEKPICVEVEDGIMSIQNCVGTTTLID